MTATLIQSPDRVMKSTSLVALSIASRSMLIYKFWRFGDMTDKLYPFMD
jgi:hypothetical protein